MNARPRLLAVGEAAFSVEFGDRLDEALNVQVHALDTALAAAPFPGLLETIPTYHSLLVKYDPLLIDAESVQAALTSITATPMMGRLSQGRLVEVPVRYGGEWGPDLDHVAVHCGLSPDQVIGLHASPLYRVAMMGFAPGFAYLFGLPPELATPRLATPRTRVAPGSIGIAGPQAGLYALPTPGGWQIIGRTSLALFDPNREAPFTLRAGDRVRFVPSEAPDA